MSVARIVGLVVTGALAVGVAAGAGLAIGNGRTLQKQYKKDGINVGLGDCITDSANIVTVLEKAKQLFTAGK